MEMIDSLHLIILAAVAFIAGFIDAIAGGGGMLTVPALLSTGLPPHIALGTNKLSSTFGSSTAAFTYYKKKLFTPQFWISSFASTLIGAIIGVLIVDKISTDLLRKILPIVILFTAIYTIFNKTSATVEQETMKITDPSSRKKKWLQGLVLGFYDGAIGPGTGSFWVVSSMSLYKLNILLASGVAKAMNFTSNITALITFIILGHVDWALGLMMGTCVMFGAFVGANSAIRFGAKFIRPVFVTMVSLLAFKLAIDAWF